MRSEASPEDTPETNAVRLDEFCNNTWENHYLAMREHARSMERQRDALQRIIDEINRQHTTHT